MSKKEEYIEYLKSFDNKELNEKINLYNKKIINYSDLEKYAIENELLSEYSYFKSFKIGDFLK